MTIKKFSLSSNLLLVALLIFGLSTSLHSTLAAWVAPTATPPSGNIAGPVNVGSIIQSKSGALNVMGGFSVSVNDLFVDTSVGRVGIGTNAPAYKLSVDGVFGPGANTRSGGGHGGIDFTNNGIGYQYSAKIYTFRDSSSGEYYGLTNDYDGGGAQLSLIAKQAGGQIGFYTGDPATRKMTINASGNVGIGKTNPATALDVNGTVTAAQFVGGGAGITGVTASTANHLTNTGYGSTSFTWHQTSGTFAGYTGWANHLISAHGDGATYYNQVITMPFWSAPQYSRLEGGVFKGPYTFLSTENYGSYALPLSGGNVTGNVNISGNVGIGTVNPGAKLEVAGQVKITGGTPGANKVLTSDASGLASWVTPTTAATTWASVTSKSLGDIARSDSTLDIGVSQYMRWKNYGNGHVIIDASNGTAPNGSAIDKANSQYAWAATYPTLMGWNGANTYGVRVDSARVADSATDATKVLKTGDTMTGEFDATGGTGTAYNTAPIEVRTTLTPRISFHWPGVVASQIGMDSSGKIRTYDNPGTGYADFAARGIDANSLSGNGGFFSSGNMDGTGSAAYFPSGIYSKGINAWIYGTISTNGAIVDTSSRMSLNPAGVTYFNGGKVGIGTAAPAYKLDVVGAINEIVIAGRGGSTGMYGSGTSYGVSGGAASAAGTGVYGNNSYTSATGNGVLGLATGSGNGVRGQSGSGNGGYFTSTSGFGLYGGSSSNVGVRGNSSSGIGGYFTSTSNYGMYSYSSTNTGVHGYSLTGIGGYFASNSGYGLIVGSGNVGIGTAAPGAKLEVAGLIKSSSGGFVFPDGTTQTTAGTGIPSGTLAGSCSYVGNPVTSYYCSGPAKNSILLIADYYTNACPNTVVCDSGWYPANGCHLTNYATTQLCAKW